VKIGILGTGNLAVTLGRAWTAVGHSLLLMGLNPQHAASAADQIGATAKPADPGDIAGEAGILVVAVAWDGLEEAVSLVGASGGSLAGKTVLDCTNPVNYVTGHLIPASGSAAEVVARAAAGAHVVKALHMFAGASWPFTGERASAPVVAICGDNSDAIDHDRSLIADLGSRAVAIGPLASARQAEEAAGFIMRAVAAGANQRFAVPDVNPTLLGMTEIVSY
jgi:predicted dinucleotide-binding enzyme